MTNRDFHYQDATSSKFWRIAREDSTTVIRFGRIGSEGQSQIKTYPDEQAARLAYDKQIAEKLKKGYKEVAAEHASTALPVPSAKAIPPVTTAAVEASLSPMLIATSEPFSHVELDPTDWLWATWRAWQPLERPAAPVFDKTDVLRRLARISNDAYQWSWNWDRAQIPTVPSHEEAHFWLIAMQPNGAHITPKEVAQSLADKQFDGNLDCHQAFALMDSLSHYARPIATALAATFCAPAALVADIVRKGVNTSTLAYANSQHLAAALDGFRSYILPYLDAIERQQLSQMLIPHLDVMQWPSDYYAAGPPAFYLAAMLGGHDPALRTIIESWADDRYSAEAWHDHYQRPQEIVFGLADPRLVEAHLRRLKLRLNKPAYVCSWLAHTELSALDVVRDSIIADSNKETASELLKAFACAVGPEVAPHMLEIMHDSRVPQLARDWLETYPVHTIVGLLPLAAGRGKLADAATNLLRRFARRGFANAIAEHMAVLGDDSTARLRTSILDAALAQRPPLDDVTTPSWMAEALAAQLATKLAKPTRWLHAADLPPVLVGQYRLSDEQVGMVLVALQHSKLGAPNPLIDALKQHAEPSSLDAFAWGLFEQWLMEGAPSKENWALYALGLLGGDAIALKLAPLVRIWPGESQHQRAVNGLDCLRAIGTDTALMQINGIAQKVKFKGLQSRAAEYMELMAKERGLSRAELEDRIVPDCDLDDRGERVFDFGLRQFRFALGSDMKPLIRDEQGKLKTDLPKPGAKDDAAKAAQAVADWKLLKKQVGEIAKVQALRLEQAMVTGRRWTRDEFEILLVRHPLMTHLVRRLIWAAYAPNGTLAATFRVTEDQSYADSADDTFDLTPFDAVRIVHPLYLSRSEQSAWGEMLSDYEIVPPFPQLGRPIHDLESDELAAKEITRFNQLSIPAASLVFGLDKLGWLRDAPADAGGFCGHSKPFEQANVTAVVQYEEGVAVGYIIDAPDQRLRYLAFVPNIRKPEWWPDHKERMPLSEVDPVVISEALGDLNIVMAKGK